MSALKGMFSFYTMIRLDIDQKDMDDMNKSFYLVPLIGIFYGLIAVISLRIFGEFFPLFLSAALTMFTIHLVNRFLHIDGMADVGDGLMVAGEREDHLRALKDSRIGVGGMVFAFFVILITVASIGGLPLVAGNMGWGYVLLIPFVAEILAKNATVAAAAFGTAGEGMAGESVRNTKPEHVLYSTALSALIIFVYFLFFVLADWNIDMAKMCASLVIAILASIGVGYLMAYLAKKNFGMVNGDVLGATNEIARAVTLLMMLALIFRFVW